MPSRINRSRILIVTLAAAALLTACSGSEGDGGGGASGGSDIPWTRVSHDELNARLQAEDVYLVNVHTPYEGEIPGTDAFIPYDQIASRTEELPGDPSELVIYCRSGNMSTVAAQALAAEGYSGFAELTGGYTAWTEAGLPFETPAG